MGQYFNWVNFDKNEIIEDWPWPNGNKLHESAYLGCEETDAALTMLAGDWAGDFVAFLGDYATFENETHPKRHEAGLRLAGTYCEEYIYSCADICGRFDYTRDHPETRHPVYEDDDIFETWVPYDGPFDVAIHCYRYAVNETKKEFVDRFCTAVRYIDKNTGKIVRYDPFPELMCSQTGWLEDPENEIEGRWFGDTVRPSNEHPGDGYAAVAQNYSYWAPPSITRSDEEIMRIVAEYGLDIADEDILAQIDARLP